MKGVRDHFTAYGRRQGRRIAGARKFRRRCRSRGGLSALGVSRCDGPEAGGTGEPAALCEPGVQLLRAAEPVAAGGDRTLGAAPGLCRRAMPARKSRARRFRRLRPCPRRCRRHHAGRGAAVGALAAFGRARHHRQRHRRRGLLPGALPRSVRAAAQRSDAGAQCVRGGDPLRKPGADLLPHHDAGGRTRRPSHRRRREGADVPRRRQPRSAALGKSRQLRRDPPHLRPCRIRLGHPHVRRPACSRASKAR